MYNLQNQGSITGRQNNSKFPTGFNSEMSSNNPPQPSAFKSQQVLVHFLLV